mgnify:CR=1 FL=1
MSFILDALNKSETERQRQRDPAAVVVPTAVPQRRTPMMYWVLGAIVLVNTAVILFVFWPERAAPPAPTASEPPVVVPSSEMVPLPAAAITDGEVRALAAEAETPRSVARPSVPVTRSEPSQSVVRPAAAQTGSGAGGNVPSLAELVLDGSIEPMNLHVDVHVYHPERRSRFMVLNSKRYREGDRISEGPLLESITPDGAVFVHNGRRFSITIDR